MFPIFVLVMLALPSLELLYYMDCPSSLAPFATLKAVGRQWYWYYEVTLHGADSSPDYSFDSYMLNEADLSDESFRLLETDLPVFVPRGEYIRVLVTGGDVIHSFAVPSLGIKVDAVPGRLNQSHFYPLNLGTYYGQCSEICGANHSFMPIEIEVLPVDVFKSYFVD